VLTRSSVVGGLSSGMECPGLFVTAGDEVRVHVHACMCRRGILTLPCCVATDTASLRRLQSEMATIREAVDTGVAIEPSFR
jgi:hypothetical protein